MTPWWYIQPRGSRLGTVFNCLIVFPQVCLRHCKRILHSQRTFGFSCGMVVVKVPLLLLQNVAKHVDISHGYQDGC